MKKSFLKLFGDGATQLATADIHGKILALKRNVEKWEGQAVAAERSALVNREKAFSPDTPETERARLIRQSVIDTQNAKMLSGYAATFLTQFGHYTELETVMQIADEMKEVGLIDSDVSVVDWQKAMDTMQDEIQRIIATSQKLGDVMGSVLAQDSAAVGIDMVDELDQLFAKWKSESDPAKKAEIQRQIEAKSNAALV